MPTASAGPKPQQIRWTPSFGAIPRSDGVEFRVWAPRARQVDVLFEQDGRRLSQPLDAQDGVFAAFIPRLSAGARYGFRLDDSGTVLPDPAARSLPDGPHGWSAVVDPSSFEWSDDKWTGVDPGALIIYELHVGTFTPEGTFRAAIAKLDALADLGISALELMPVAEFAGRRNWGYDGVALFAPSHHYGTPDDLRALVDEAHRRGLAVIFDVVYNHLGPDGAYVSEFAPQYFTHRHHTPWGDAINLDGPGADRVRAFLFDNALHWVHEYHADGLRIDAAHALFDDSPTHFLAELPVRIRETIPANRHVLLIAEDERNEAAIVRPSGAGGLGLDGVWADDFHHVVRRLTAGDAEGYFQSYRGDAGDLARTLAQGWLFTGQVAAHTGKPRGTDASDIPLERFVICLQNHDQVGNRPFGDRLTATVDAATYRAASALLLLAPETPLIFMGQEWGASTPFQFFTDHHAELGQAVTAGRREEFAAFRAFSDPAVRETIPDPQADETFERSRLRWEERDLAEHSRILALYRALLSLRLFEPSFHERARRRLRIEAPAADTIAIQRLDDRGSLVVVRLRGRGTVSIPLRPNGRSGPVARWRLALTTEDGAFAADAQPPAVEWTDEQVTIAFQRPSAVVFVRE
jgi:maltooligosyltrehalose trehalohydrolase